MSALQNCVLIIDEVQTVPRNMLTLFNMAMNWLATVMHATVVLCSATQPALEQTAHPIAYAPEPELVSHCAAWEVFRRTEIVDLRMPYGYTAEQLAELVQSCAQKHGSVLLVCNKNRRHGRFISCWTVSQIPFVIICPHPCVWRIGSGFCRRWIKASEGRSEPFAFPRSWWRPVWIFLSAA